MTSVYPLIQFNAGSRAFLARAIDHLSLFEGGGSFEHFYFASLELRFGIEARLTEYLLPALRSVGKDDDELTEYVATKLLRRLVDTDPDASRPGGLRVTSESSGHSSLHQFVPVSKRLAVIHGQLGELLHIKFFISNKHWNLRVPLGGAPHRSSADFVPLLREGIEELKHSTSGTLLSHPAFTKVVEDVLRDDPEPPSPSV